MKKVSFVKIIFLLIFSCFFFSCSNDANEIETVQPKVELRTYTHSNYEIELLNLVNQDRVSKGLNALTIISEISYVSSTHNDYMILNNQASHDNFEQRKETIKNGLGAITVGENVASGFSSAQSTLNAWNNSVAHKANLESNYTHFGLSVKEDTSGRKYYTLMFIRK